MMNKEEKDFFKNTAELLVKDPAKVAVLAYFWLTANGYARLFGVGAYFDINVLDFVAPADFLLAGVRDPLVPVLAILSGGLVIKVWFWSNRWADRNPGIGAFRRVVVRTSAGLVAVALMALSAWGHALYRRDVVSGERADKPWAPRPATVLVEKGETVEALAGLRLIVATTDYFVFFRPPTTTEPIDAVVVLKRDEVKRMDLPHRN